MSSERDVGCLAERSEQRRWDRFVERDLDDLARRDLLARDHDCRPQQNATLLVNQEVQLVAERAKLLEETPSLRRAMTSMLGLPRDVVGDLVSNL